MKSILEYQNVFETYLAANPLSKEPKNLYEPADYILSIGGKRLRPLFALMGADIYGGSDDALKIAMAVEVFHNFTLLHDDIMDASDIRRGQPTVHKKYNVNTAILTGDVMLIKAYQYIADVQDKGKIGLLLDVFNTMAVQLCEGQQYDVDFESRHDVTIPEYIDMITWKTSVLIAAAMQMGAIVGGAHEEDQRHIYEYAKNFGIAFQFQDDVLDTFGESASVGKKIGGDIIQNKKTYLYLKTLELCSTEQKKVLLDLYDPQTQTEEAEKIAIVKEIFNSVVIQEYANQVIAAYRDLSISHLQACNISESHKQALTDFVDKMIFRIS
jgi:geranylgeranyl diphosphate synthase, type II